MSERSASAAADRPWLTMLHGFSQSAAMFDRQKSCFEASHRVFCPELLGHGARDLETADYSIPAHARDVLHRMRAHGVGRTHFWGTHTGTAVGMLLALERPSPISSLILEAPVVPGIELPVVAARIERARSIARRLGVREAMEDWFREAEWFRAIRENPVAFRAVEQREIVLRFEGRPLLVDPPAGPAFSLVERLEQIDCPVLIYNGSEDVDDFKRTAAWLATRLRRARRVELPGLGGFPAWESPERVNALVDRFLSELS